MEQSIPFRLIKINTEQFATVESAYPTSGEDNGIETVSGFSISVSPSDKLIKCGINLAFENKNTAFIILNINCEFLINEQGWQYFQKKEGEVEIGKEFAQHMAVLTTGTARGILHAKTENTKFNKYVLPTLNLTEIFTENLIIKLAD